MAVAVDLYESVQGRGRDDLVIAHMGMVKRVALHLKARLPPFMEVDELVQVGMLGLIEAARGFDASKGIGFENYAHSRVRGAIIDEVRRLSALPRSAVSQASELTSAFKALGGRDLILEGFVSFDRELSVIAVRGRDGEQRFYDLTQNYHAAGILRTSIAPAPEQSPQLLHAAHAIARATLEALQYVGVLAIELFQVGDRLIVNEMAPRVHNSGHWTIEGAVTSQFENHVRAVLGLPLGDTRVRGVAVMKNLIGSAPRIERLLAIEGVALHLYGKDPKPGRKLGHITVVAPDLASAQRLNHEVDEVCK